MTQTQPAVQPTITISLRIENTYDDGDEVVTTFTDEVVPAPPQLDEDSDAYREWADEHVYGFTGTGRCDGDSWYDVKVTACTEPEMVGRTFEFGY